MSQLTIHVHVVAYIHTYREMATPCTMYTSLVPKPLSAFREEPWAWGYVYTIVPWCSITGRDNGNGSLTFSAAWPPHCRDGRNREIYWHHNSTVCIHQHWILHGHVNGVGYTWTCTYIHTHGLDDHVHVHGQCVWTEPFVLSPIHRRYRANFLAM